MKTFTEGKPTIKWKGKMNCPNCKHKHNPRLMSSEYLPDPKEVIPGWGWRTEQIKFDCFNCGHPLQVWTKQSHKDAAKGWVYIDTQTDHWEKQQRKQAEKDSNYE